MHRRVKISAQNNNVTHDFDIWYTAHNYCRYHINYCNIILNIIFKVENLGKPETMSTNIKIFSILNWFMTKCKLRLVTVYILSSMQPSYYLRWLLFLRIWEGLLFFQAVIFLCLFCICIFSMGLAYENVEKVHLLGIPLLLSVQVSTLLGIILCV